MTRKPHSPECPDCVKVLALLRLACPEIGDGGDFDIVSLAHYVRDELEQARSDVRRLDARTSTRDTANRPPS